MVKARMFFIDVNSTGMGTLKGVVVFVVVVVVVVGGAVGYVGGVMR